MQVVQGDGTKGYQKAAPYDRIIVAASSPNIPEPLVQQLKPGGRMVIPVEDTLLLVEKTGKDKARTTTLGFYAFVPLIGEHGHKS